ncbi:hypothetical protein [Novosphingobium huizhouense]|uniref:hypothetical protein n=1 Tax=Novosphingobium huizhouense TaxID=2866625 RepID=UPI001CD83631|nr:hypothetical protein [Novosphingobium huizhouense]
MTSTEAFLGLTVVICMADHMDAMEENCVVVAKQLFTDKARFEGAEQALTQLRR